jgi:O-antigen/teichoic acid export membrane protein
MISRSFLKSSLLFTVGGAMPMLASIILLPFYTNRLSEVHYTQVLFYISISLLFQIFFSFSIESYFGIKYTQLSNDVSTQRRFVGTTSILLLFIGAGLLLLTAISGPRLFSIVYSDAIGMDFWPYGFYSVLTAFFNSYFKAATICMIYFKQARLFLIVNIINFIATLAITLGGLHFYPDTIIGPIYGRLLSGLIIFVIALVIFKSNGVFTFDKLFLRELIGFCAPYFFFAVSIWILGQVDRYMLQKYIPFDDLNAYDLVLKCFFGIEFLQNSLTAVIFPRLYEIWNRNNDHSTTSESNRYFNVFTAVNILQLILFCIFLPLLYRMVIKNTAFYESERYIGLLAAGYGLRAILSFYMSTILFSKKLSVLLKIFGIASVFQIILTWFMVGYWGLMGAIYAGLATRIAQIVLCMMLTGGVFTYRFNYFKIVTIPFIYIAFNVVQFLLHPEYNLWLYVIQLVLFGILFYAVFRNEIRKVLVSFNLLAVKAQN